MDSGQVLGLEGATGTATGKHLHFEVLTNGTPIDPVPFMAEHGAPLDGRAVAPAPSTATPAGVERGIGFDLPPAGTPRLNSLGTPPATIPAQVKALYLDAATKYQLPWTLLAGIGMEETAHGRATATSTAGAQGLMQFMPATFAAYGVDGDGDGMTWADLQWVLDAVEPHGVKFTFYLMDEQIEAFSSEDVAAVRARGHDFGPHPWTGLQPTPEQWTDEIGRIVSSFSDKFGFAPDSYRSHCVIFPGWDHAPRVAAGAGLRLDTNFVPGYRFSTGYLNGSALPVRFIGADGEVLEHAIVAPRAPAASAGATTPAARPPVKRFRRNRRRGSGLRRSSLQRRAPGVSGENCRIDPGNRQEKGFPER
mgnify:CR=1 FL=1